MARTIREPRATRGREAADLALPAVPRMADELFRLVEYNQGKAFISDGMGVFATREELLAVVRGCLAQSRLATNKMAAWLEKYERALRSAALVASQRASAKEPRP